MTNTFESRGSVTVIHIPHKGVVLEGLIDTVDLALVAGFPGTWYGMWSKDSQTFYVIGRYGGKGVLLHRLLTGEEQGQEVDHLHHYGLDNRRSQIKVCGRSENASNRLGPNSNNKSGYIGVYWHAKSGKWRAQVSAGGKRRDVHGAFATAEEASAARSLLADASLARPNFPPATTRGAA